MALFLSCVGASSVISIRGDGSGTMLLEYRIAKELEELGKLDGNERWLPVPSGRADIERSVSRVRGMKLVSFRERNDGKDIVLTCRLDFSSSEALLAFLDASGQQAEFDTARRRLAFKFSGGAGFDNNASPAFGQDLGQAAGRAFSGYGFSLSLRLPAAAKLRWLDENGKETRPPGSASVKGPSGPVLEFGVPMADLVLLEKDLVMEITW